MTETPPPPPLPVRLVLVQAGTGPHLVDGAWWPRSRELVSELPHVLSMLEHRWGSITRVTVDAKTGLIGPEKLELADREVHITWSTTGGNRHTICLVSYGVGRCDLLVIPPDTPDIEARRLMAEVAGGNLPHPPGAPEGPHVPHQPVEGSEPQTSSEPT